MDAKNVSAAKPKIGGSVFVAPLGTKLPEDAKSELDTKFNSLGYCSDDGVSNNNSPETDTQKAWGGAVVLNLFSGKEDTFKFIIKVKGRLGHKTPILALIEGGTAQDIFSILKAGVYDYLVTTENLQEYKKKIEDIVLWDWYLKKYDD